MNLEINKSGTNKDNSSPEYTNTNSKKVVNSVKENNTDVKKPPCNLTEKNKPNLILMAKAFTNLYNQSKKMA